jgi:hypothetical protein
MTDISIDVAPDPERDVQARRAALALLTAALYDPQDDGPRELSSAALADLVEQVVSEIGGVREESKEALQVMLSVVARHYSAFTAMALLLATEGFSAGQRDPLGEEPDYLALLDRVRAVIEGA